MRFNFFTVVATFSLLLIFASFETPAVVAQGFGGGGGFGGVGASSSSMNPSSHRFDPNRMTHSHGDLRFHGSVVVQLKPEKIRVVLAVVSEAETAEDCHALNVAAVKKVRDVWRTMGIEDDNVVEDFIAMLPRYEWFYERRMAKLTDSEEWIKEMMKMDADQREDFDPDFFVNPDFFKLAIMKKTGHRIQSNIHLETDTESNAMKAINAAFENGVKDIIAFDYWSSKTDQARKEAMSKALQEAKTKADTLLSVFDKKPLVIDVDERTEVIQPSSQYETFVNVLDDEFKRASWSGYHKIKEYSPKQSFYRGVPANADLQAERLPMEPSIVVTSKVTISYRPPGSKRVIVQE